MEQEQVKTKILPNGAVYDLEKHRIIANPGGGRGAFTPESARQAQARRLELKRAAVVAGANAAVERGEYHEQFGDLAFVSAIAEVQADKALTPDDPKSTDAARFVFQEAGVAEMLSRGVEVGAALGAVPSRVVLLLAELASRQPVDFEEGVINQPSLDGGE